MEGYTLAGKTALVTGVEHAVAHATAMTLAEAGADVAVLAGNAGARARAEAAAAAVQQHQRQSLAYAINVRDATVVQSTVDTVAHTWGHLDILINGLDLPFAAPFLDNTPEAWDTVFSHNLHGTMHCIQAAGRHMLAQQHGRIITYISILAERGVANCAAYSAAQAALLQLTRSLAIEWGTQGVTLNAIGSGWMQDSPFLPTTDDALERLQRYIPNHRFGQPDDLVTLATYLASDLGGNVTGQVMYIEGGVMAHP
jgi:NAD(P)-dependent dehydrogenase (short-subunit alcohol dehydrogenase family)